LEKARKRARLIPWSFLPAPLGAALAWWLSAGDWRLAAITAGGALLLPLIAWMLTRAVITRAHDDLYEKLHAAGGTLRKLLSDQITEDTESTFARFLGILTPAREESVIREQRIGSHASGLHRLQESFGDLDRRLQAAVAKV
jgi:hypothetical protein